MMKGTISKRNITMLFIGFVLFMVLAITSLYCGKDVSAKAEEPNQTYYIYNITKDKYTIIDYKNDFKPTAYTPADKIVAFDSETDVDFVETPYGVTFRYIVVIEPDGDGYKVAKSGDVSTGPNQELGVVIPEGGYVLVGHGIGATTLTNDFAVGDLTDALVNNSDFVVINKTKAQEVNIRAKNTAIAGDDVVLYTSSYSAAIKEYGYRSYITAVWDASQNGYVVTDVTGYMNADGDTYYVPEGGIVLEAHGIQAGGTYTSAFMDPAVTKVGDIITVNIKYNLTSTDITVPVGQGLKVDGINPNDKDIPLQNKTIIYTNTAGYLKTYSRFNDASFVEYAVKIEGQSHIIIEKYTTDKTFIPVNGYVISIPSSVEGFDSLNVGDSIVLSGNDANIPVYNTIIDNITQNIRLIVAGKNKSWGGDDVILFDDMPADLTIENWVTKAIISFDRQSGKYISSGAIKGGAEYGKTIAQTIPSGGFVLGGHGSTELLIGSFRENDEITLFDSSRGVKSTDVTVSVGNKTITLDGINPSKTTETLGKNVIYTAVNGKLSTHYRQDAAVTEIIVNIFGKDHVISEVKNETGNIIPFHGYILSIPQDSSNLSDFTVGSKINFIDNNTQKVSFADKTFDYVEGNSRIIFAKSNADYATDDIILFDSLTFKSSAENAKEGFTPANPYSKDVVVVLQDGKYIISQIVDGGGTPIPANGFIIGFQGGSMAHVATFPVDAEVVINDYTADMSTSLKNIKLGDTSLEEFTSEQREYIVTLPIGSAAPEVSFEKIFAQQKASVVNATTVPGTATITVTSRNGMAEGTYSINFKYSLKTDAKLSSIKLGDKDLDGFNTTTRNYTLYVNYGTTTFEQVTAFTADADASVSIVQATVTSPVAVITVSAEDRDYTMVYKVNFVIVDTSLNSIKIADTEIDGFSADITEYTVKLEKNASIPQIEAIAKDSNATVTIKNALNVNEKTTITIKGANGEFTRVYTISFEQAKGSSAVYIIISIVAISLVAAGAVIFVRKKKTK